MRQADCQRNEPLVGAASSQAMPCKFSFGTGMPLTCRMIFGIQVHDLSQQAGALHVPSMFAHKACTHGTFGLNLSESASLLQLATTSPCEKFGQSLCPQLYMVTALTACLLHCSHTCSLCSLACMLPMQQPVCPVYQSCRWLLMTVDASNDISHSGDVYYRISDQVALQQFLCMRL